MKKYNILSIGILFLLLTVGGIAYGQGGMDDPSSQSSGSSADQSGMGQAGTSGMDQSGTSGMGKAGTSGTSGAPAVKVDINTASAKELEGVPGMTKTMAKDIVKYRDQNGPFSSVEDLTKVKGISESKLNAMRNSLMIGQAAGRAAPMGGSQQGTGGMGAGESGSSSGSSGY